jgi:hypothetical protein
VLAEAPLRAAVPAQALLLPVLALACAAVLAQDLVAPVLAAASAAFLVLALLVPVPVLLVLAGLWLLVYWLLAIGCCLLSIVY